MEALLTEPKVTINPLLHDQRIDYFLPIYTEFGLYRQVSRGGSSSFCSETARQN